MPRQIIDTESSRPQYVRRTAIRAAAVVLILIVLAVLLFLYERHRLALPAASPAKTSTAFQETRGVVGEPGSPSHPRRSHAA